MALKEVWEWEGVSLNTCHRPTEGPFSDCGIYFTEQHWESWLILHLQMAQCGLGAKDSMALMGRRQRSQPNLDWEEACQDLLCHTIPVSGCSSASCLLSPFRLNLQLHKGTHKTPSQRTPYFKRMIQRMRSLSQSVYPSAWCALLWLP